MEEFVLTAKPRDEFGTRAARVLRARGLLPANIYGHGEPNVLVCLDSRSFEQFFEAGHRVAKIEIEGQPEEHGVVKAVQYDALGSDILHVDFTRLSKGEAIRVEVPLDLVGVPHGTSGAGVMEVRLREISVEGPAADVPETYPLNVENAELGTVIRVRDLTPPKGCVFTDDPEEVVVAFGEAHEEPEAEPGAESSSPTEPEVIGKKKDDEASDETGS